MTTIARGTAGADARGPAIAKGSADRAAPRIARGGGDASPAIAHGRPGDGAAIRPSDEASGDPDLRGAAASGAAHLAAFALLSMSIVATRPPPPPEPSAMTVSLVDGAPAQGPVVPAPAPAPTPAPAQIVPAPMDAPAPDRIVPSPAPDPLQPVAALAQTAPSDAPVGGARVAIGVKPTGVDLDPEMAAGVGRSVMARLANCWARPADAPAGVSSIVRVRYAQDGSVLGDPQVIRVVSQTETAVSDPNPWERAALDAVRRCSPLGLPQGLYPYWSSVDVQVFS